MPKVWKKVREKALAGEREEAHHGAIADNPFSYRELKLAELQGHRVNAQRKSRLLPTHSVWSCVTGIVLLTC